MKRFRGDIYWWASRRQWAADVPALDADGQPTVDKNGKLKRTRWSLGPEKLRAEAEFYRRMAGRADYHLLKRLGPTPDLTLVELARQYLDWLKAFRSHSHWRTTRGYLRWLVTEERADALAQHVTPQLIDQIKAAHLKCNAPTSVNHFVRAVKGMYRWALKRVLLTVNPVQFVEGVARPVFQLRALTDAQIAEVLAAADARPPLGDFCRVLLLTGMRCGELAGLPCSAYDAEAGTLTVESHKTVGRTGLSRIVPVSEECAAVLARQVGTETIFGVTASGLRQRWKRLAKRRPALAGVTFHAFRHSFVSRALAAGIPEAHVQQIVGHSTTAMLRHYARQHAQGLRDVIGRVKLPAL